VKALIRVHVLLCLVCCLLLQQHACYAQNMFKTKRYTYLSASVGPSKYLGDIGTQTDNFWNQYNINQGTWFGGGALQRVYHRKASIELGLQIGKLQAADRTIAFTSTADPNYLLFKRNLDFRTRIVEASLSTSVMPFTTLFPKKKIATYQIQPFLSAGLGIYSFKPQGSVYDALFDDIVWYDLQPLSTEGQGFAEYPDRQPYKLTQFNLQYGGGFNYNLSQYYYCAIGINGRKLFTDYLDDVSSTYANVTVYDRYFTDQELAELAKLFSNKSVLTEPFTPFREGEIRGNNKKFDGYFTIYAKVGFRIGARKSNEAEHYKYDDNEICD
jgi:hypothetical protein